LNRRVGERTNWKGFLVNFTEVGPE
jgi:hypothetical protein